MILHDRVLCDSRVKVQIHGLLSGSACEFIRFLSDRLVFVFLLARAKKATGFTDIGFVAGEAWDFINDVCSVISSAFVFGMDQYIAKFGVRFDRRSYVMFSEDALYFLCDTCNIWQRNICQGFLLLESAVIHH